MKGHFIKILFTILFLSTKAVSAQEVFYNLDNDFTYNVRLNDKTIFYLPDPNVNESRLMVTDGTTDGTFELARFENLPYPYLYTYFTEDAIYNNVFYFEAASNRDENRALWRTDGTVEGTFKLYDLNEISQPQPRHFKFYEGKLWFIADKYYEDQSATRSTLFSIDELGNLKFYPFTNSVGSILPTYGFEIYDGALFTFSSGFDGIYVFDSDSENFSLVVGGFSVLYMQATSRGLFVVGAEDIIGKQSDTAVYLLDSNSEFTLINNSKIDRADIIPPYWGGGQTHIINEGGPWFWEVFGRVYYIARTESDGNTALWSTDGSPAGTRQHFSPGNNFTFDALFAAGGNVFFGAERDIDGDGFEDDTFLYMYSPSTDVVTPLMKDDYLVRVPSQDRFTLTFFDLGYIEYGQYVIFSAILTPPDLNFDNTLFGELLIMDTTTGLSDFVISPDSDIQNKGILNILGDQLLFTGNDDISTFPEDRLFKVDITELELDFGPLPSLSNQQILYEERFYDFRGDTLFKPFDWVITESNIFGVEGSDLSWRYFEKNSLSDQSVIETWLDNTGFGVINYSFVFDDPDLNLNESIESPLIDISNATNLSASIEFMRAPSIMELLQETIRIQAKTENSDWVTLSTLRGNSIEEVLVDTLQLNLNVIPQGNTLQFRFNYQSPKNTLGVGFNTFFLDRLKLYGTLIENDDIQNQVFEETTLIEEGFTVAVWESNEDLKWEIVQSNLDSANQSNSQWKSFGVPDNGTFGNILPGISLDGHLSIMPNDQYVWGPDQILLDYDEIIASPFYNLTSSDSLRVSLNLIYHPVFFKYFNAEINVLGRNSIEDEWTIINQTNSNTQIHLNRTSLDLDRVDASLPGNLYQNNIQIGLQLAIKGDPNLNAGLGFFADSLRIYSRDAVQSTSLETEKPGKFKLYQNYPNPFNPTTTINFELDRSQKVSLTVFDVLGREIYTVVNSTLLEGFHSYNFEATNLSTGIYFYQLKSEDFVETKKMMLIK